MRQALSLLILLSTLALAMPGRGEADPAPPPGPEALTRVRSGLRFKPLALTGHLRTAKARHPLTLNASADSLTYELPESGLAWRVRFQESGVTLTERNRAGTFTPPPAADRTKAVLGSDLVPEDLTLDFLYWPGITVIGTDNLKTRRCFVYEVTPGAKGARFAKVRLWIDAAGFALLRADAFNAQNQCIKRLEVNAVQQIENAWIIKEFQVSTMMPDRNLSKSRTYLNLDEAAPK